MHLLRYKPSLDARFPTTPTPRKAHSGESTCLKLGQALGPTSRLYRQYRVEPDATKADSPVTPPSARLVDKSTRRLALTHVLRTYTQLWAPVRMSFAIQTHRALVKMEAELETPNILIFEKKINAVNLATGLMNNSAPKRTGTHVNATAGLKSISEITASLRCQKTALSRRVFPLR